MSTQFPKTQGKTLGYNPAQVDQLVNLARQQFANPTSHSVSAKSLRLAQFELVPGGYVIEAVDSALDRLDDAFAVQDVKRLVAQLGEHGAKERLASVRALLSGRIGRGSGKRFAKTGIWKKGYAPKQVDELVELVGEQLAGKKSVPVGILRETTFKPVWGGYVENQVDAFIDKSVEFIQLQESLGL